MVDELATTYAQYDMHLELVDAMRDDDSEIVEGWAIRSEDLSSFLFDLRQLVERYGVTYDELLDKDLEDSSITSSVRTSRLGEGVPAIDDTIVVG